MDASPRDIARQSLEERAADLRRAKRIAEAEMERTVRYLIERVRAAGGTLILDQFRRVQVSGATVPAELVQLISRHGARVAAVLRREASVEAQPAVPAPDSPPPPKRAATHSRSHLKSFLKG